MCNLAACLGSEGGLPGRGLDLANATQQLCSGLDARVLVAHHAHAGGLYAQRKPAVEGDEQQHHHQPSHKCSLHLRHVQQECSQERIECSLLQRD